MPSPQRVTCGSADGGEGGGRDTGYLAQHPLLEQIPELRADVEQPEYCALGEGDLRSVNAWFGPAGTVSGFGALHLLQRLCNKAPPQPSAHQLLISKP